MRRRITSLALLGAAAFTAAGGTARADELTALKAEIAALDARVAALPQPAVAGDGYRLLSMSAGAIEEVPGAPLRARERAAYGGRATIISVLPAADAAPTATISWSGYARAGAVYHGQREDTVAKAYSLQNGSWLRDPAGDLKTTDNFDDYDVLSRGQLLVQAATETRVGKIGVELELRADADGNGAADLYTKVAWGYWEMTPELTLGGGYNQSLGDIVYGYDGSCTCYYTDNADVDFDPGDTTQLRLSYVSGPVTFAAAVEDASFEIEDVPSETNAIPFVTMPVSKGLLGVSGEIAYAGDVFSGEIAGTWRDSNEAETGASQNWQVGLGGSIALGDIGSFTFAAATGEGPFELVSSGTIVNGLPYNNQWWGVSAFSSIKLGEAAHMELAGGYKQRDGDQSSYKGYAVSNVDYDTYAVLGGLYYAPVSQLTLGLEGEWYTASTTADAVKDNMKYVLDAQSDTLWVDAVAVWSF